MNIEPGLARLIGLLRPESDIPNGPVERWRLYRSLMNLRMPGTLDEAFLCAQDEVLRGVAAQRGITQGRELPPAALDTRLSLWKGDITTLAVDAIVNAANEQMLGCFIPCHSCIDNAIHTFAGSRLRDACNAMMKAQGHNEPVGQAKITPAFHLPSRYILHTVGPTVSGALTETHRKRLAACYESCLEQSDVQGLASIAFCCISTGVYRFPKQEAARIAMDTVRRWLDTHNTTITKVIFNVYEESDYELYRRLLASD
jgi:Predicted phosphatase homologous to the C-terminal domain of histone macroH2A1